MRFDQALAAKMHSRRAHQHIEYPKYITVEGKSVLALDAEHEIELLGLSDPVDEVPVEDPIDVANNLLSAPEKRKGGWPAGKPRKLVPVPSHSDKD